MQDGGRTVVFGTMQEGIGAAASAPERIIGRKAATRIGGA
jgi:hypothetical protein